MKKAHLVRLHPTPEQAQYFAKAAGVARHAYNWGLAQWKREYAVFAAIKEGRASAYPPVDEQGNPTQRKAPSANALKKQYTAIKREHFPFVMDVTKCAPEQAFADLGKAFSRFFSGLARYPRLKSKKRSRPSFYVSNDKFKVRGHTIILPHVGRVNMAEKLHFKGTIQSVRISRRANWWFAAITVEIPDETHLLPDRPSVGIDVGLNRLATMSSGEVAENQRCLATKLKKLKQANQRLHRRVKGSANREKARRKVARLHYKIACLRDDVLHKLTTQLVQSYAIIGVESLHVKGLIRNRKLSRSFSDAALGRLLALLKNKATQWGSIVIVVDRFFPSSQLCSCCGWRWVDITLADRQFICQNCGLVMDRDLNASLNILQEALRLFAEMQSKGKAVFESGHRETKKTPLDLV